MGDQDQGAGERLKLFPQNRQSFFVQVGGRFIRQQQLGTGGQRRGNPLAGHLSSGEAFPPGLCAEKRLQLTVFLSVFLSLLMNKSKGSGAVNDSLVCFLLAGKNAQQRCFPCAVLADQADSFVVIYRQMIQINQLPGPEGFAEPVRFQ